MNQFVTLNRDPAVERFEYLLRQSIPAHIGRFIAGEPTVFHEIVSNDLHLDIYCWAPTKHRNLWTFVTVGMSAHEMNIPAGYEYYRRTELVATAPGHWPGLTEIQQMPQSKAKKYAWLIEAIKNTARRPFYTNSWVGIGPTTQARSTPQGKYPGSSYSGLLLSPVLSMPKEAQTLEVDGQPVHLIGLYPLFTDELRFCMRQGFGGGSHELFHRILRRGLHEGVCQNRPWLT